MPAQPASVDEVSHPSRRARERALGERRLPRVQQVRRPAREPAPYAGDRLRPELLQFIVVDNASTDGSAEMVEAEFPDVRLIIRDVNNGVSGFNDGFDAAAGDLVLALDDDCYLPPDGLKRAIEAAREHDADLVSFGVVSSYDPGTRFDKKYPTGLLSFWGCAVLMRREVLDELRGYDPNIFVWANELEFMLRFFDVGAFVICTCPRWSRYT